MVAKRLGVGAASPATTAGASENVSEDWTKSIKKQILNVGKKRRHDNIYGEDDNDDDNDAADGNSSSDEEEGRTTAVKERKKKKTTVPVVPPYRRLYHPFLVRTPPLRSRRGREPRGETHRTCQVR
eukprot:scaffold7401_cov133-Skeletonema_dohrnii-CCMP3373.AAC.3